MVTLAERFFFVQMIPVFNLTWRAQGIGLALRWRCVGVAFALRCKSADVLIFLQRTVEIDVAFFLLMLGYDLRLSNKS